MKAHCRMKRLAFFALCCPILLLGVSPVPGQVDSKTLESTLRDTRRILIGSWSTDQEATLAYIAKRPNAGLIAPPFSSSRVRELKLVFADDGTTKVDGPMQTRAPATARFVVVVDDNRNTYLITTYEQLSEAHGNDEKKKHSVRKSRKQVVTLRIKCEGDQLITMFDGVADGTQCTVYRRTGSARKNE